MEFDATRVSALCDDSVLPFTHHHEAAEGPGPAKPCQPAHAQGGKAGRGVLAADDEEVMPIRIPHDVRVLLDRERAQDAKDRRAARLRERAGVREQARSRAEKRQLAREALTWARALAEQCDLPARGVEILNVGAERTTTTVLVLPGGALEFRHVVAPFAAFRIVGRKADEFGGVPLDVLSQVVAAIRTDAAVWECVRRALDRRDNRVS